MKTNYLFTLLFFFVFISGFAQNSLNHYKYIIIPNKFDFLKEADKYQLNSLTKFLFEKYAFTAIMNNEQYPTDLANNSCLALNSNVINNSGLFKTKFVVELKDCNNNVVFSSKEGTSREKEYKKAYNLALRDAFSSFKTVNYVYKPNEEIVTKTINSESNVSLVTETNSEVEELKDEIEKLKKEKEIALARTTVVVDTNTKDTLETIKKPIKNLERDITTNMLYAQEIPNGYQLVDNTPKIIMILFQSGKKDMFFVKNNQAIVYKENGKWFFI